MRKCNKTSPYNSSHLYLRLSGLDIDDDTPISSIWETRWFDHAALVGRFMAEDKIQSDKGAVNSDTLQCKS